MRANLQVVNQVCGNGAYLGVYERRVGKHVKPLGACPREHVVVRASTPRRPRGRRDDDRWAIPYGEFSTRKAASLLNISVL